jgi:hypothetical protein
MTAPAKTPRFNKNRHKKQEAATKKNAQVVFANTLESKAMRELVVAYDQMFCHINTAMNSTMTREEGFRHFEDAATIIYQLEKLATAFAENCGYEHYRTPAITSLVIEQVKKNMGSDE